MKTAQAQAFGLGLKCTESAVSSEAKITLKSMHGVFIVFFVFAALALTLQTIESKVPSKSTEPASSGPSAHTEGEMLLMLLKMVGELNERAAAGASGNATAPNGTRSDACADAVIATT